VADKLIPNDPGLASVPEARIAILPGQGATGDGDEALGDALAQALLGRVPLDAAPSTQNYVVTVRCAVKRQGAQDVVALVWLVTDSRGREAARLSQTNKVPAGSLDKAWGATARQAANAAADALIPVLRGLPPIPPP